MDIVSEIIPIDKVIQRVHHFTDNGSPFTEWYSPEGDNSIGEGDISRDEGDVRWSEGDIRQGEGDISRGEAPRLMVWQRVRDLAKLDLKERQCIKMGLSEVRLGVLEFCRFK